MFFKKKINEDWKNLALFIPKSDPINLKYRFFTYMSKTEGSKIWTDDQDQLLKRTIK